LRELAVNVKYPHTYIGRVERGEQLPSEALAASLDVYFETDGLVSELLEMAQDTSIPDYGRISVGIEAKAERIQVCSSSLIPGLLQTEAYARALMQQAVPSPELDSIEARLAARMRRKKVFTREFPPLFWAVLDEAALKRPCGDRACMRDQLTSLLETAVDPHNTIQVLPFSQGIYPLLGGSLLLLTLENGDTVGYTENFEFGQMTESSKKIVRLTQQFDLARAKALPERESLDLIATYLKEYET
jgi:hypothetical protein